MEHWIFLLRTWQQWILSLDIGFLYLGSSRVRFCSVEILLSHLVTMMMMIMLIKSEVNHCLVQMIPTQQVFHQILLTNYQKVRSM
ncbi:MAG: hypothetical protein CMJ52_09240 [Planctomycetaceae bacterium]|nr:hypothetical protein [Planctomycetaceae bacterium]